jgi:membrane-associated phospholipid phosphatase
MRLILMLLGLMICATAGVADEGAKRPPEGVSDVLTVHAKRPSQWKQAVDVTVVTAVSVEALKRVIKDPRPHGEGHAHGSGYGFPSGDATLAFALARVASEYHHEHRALWYALAGRVAWSRVKRQAHDWDDVIGGALLGSWIGDTAVSEGGIVLKKWEW